MSLLSLSLLLLLLPLISSQPPPFPFTTSYLIDCGGLNNFTSDLNRTWLSDRFYTGGAPGLVSEPHNFPQPQERTLRFFPPNSYGKKNCYSLPSLPSGRYYLRTFTVYDNYDSKLRSPSFDVSVEGTLVFSWRSPWPETVSKDGAYSDLFAFVKDGVADVCFYSIATDPPVIASLELVQVDPLSYDSSSTGSDLVLVNYGRFTCGSNTFGPGFSDDVDPFGRVWQSDAASRNANSKVRVLSTTNVIANAGRPSNYFPMRLYQTAVTTESRAGGGIIEYFLNVDTRLDYLIWFHFAEIDPMVVEAGQRVFDVYVDGLNVRRIDVYKEVGAFSAFDWHYVVEKLNTTSLSVKFVSVVGPPLISGLENYAMVPLDFSTVPSQVAAMRALKDSLRIPDRMGWNGDPCAPSTWDAWEGVTCHPNPDGSGSLVVTQLDLGSQGLKGYISDQISLLSNLVSLNLSSNSLRGNLPLGMGQKSLVRLDLSNNQLSGAIPDSLGSSSLQLALLNNNELEGQVPEKLYSVGVHGGVIDLSSNRGLCGVPTMPACPFFWENKSISTGGKVAIGLSCVVVLVLLVLMVYICCIRRGRNDYDFALPQDLISIAAKRNRYQRQKSLMLLELETQHTNGFPATMSPL
ncbi:putative LRR receptor-like serine/threonine-protein kinase [Acorus calamus]|uniref:LRR receptor-like serine/threonine-protein kinase n=1 Tax=Acorus calamus TaxID=4465 RepID=A0AAV9FAE1_ACOCL|nr:putative LRR receptor-like serine/threonine-protein kinase [Acorus calamus]